jgi:hypothetical protein
VNSTNVAGPRNDAVKATFEGTLAMNTVSKRSLSHRNLGAPGGTLTPDHLVRSHGDEFNYSTKTVTCDACRIRKHDVTR